MNDIVQFYENHNKEIKISILIILVALVLIMVFMISGPDDFKSDGEAINLNYENNTKNYIQNTSIKTTYNSNSVIKQNNTFTIDKTNKQYTLESQYINSSSEIPYESEYHYKDDKLYEYNSNLDEWKEIPVHSKPLFFKDDVNLEELYNNSNAQSDNSINFELYNQNSTYEYRSELHNWTRIEKPIVNQDFNSYEMVINYNSDYYITKISINSRDDVNNIEFEIIHEFEYNDSISIENTK